MDSINSDKRASISQREKDERLAAMKDEWEKKAIRNYVEQYPSKFPSVDIASMQQDSPKTLDIYQAIAILQTQSLRTGTNTSLSINNFTHTLHSVKKAGSFDYLGSFMCSESKDKSSCVITASNHPPANDPEESKYYMTLALAAIKQTGLPTKNNPIVCSGGPPPLKQWKS